MEGDLLKQEDVDAIVNTVNCVGVMGKGIRVTNLRKNGQTISKPTHQLVKINK